MAVDAGAVVELRAAVAEVPAQECVYERVHMHCALLFAM